MQTHHSRRRQTAPPLPMAESTIRVLVLEDDTDLRDVLATLLGMEEGFQMEACKDVDGCLRLLRAAGQPGGDPPFDALLLDLHLPGGRSGTEVLEAARADTALHLPPVVVCTALPMRDLDAYLSLFASLHIRVVTKPFDNDHLLDTLRAAAASRTR